MPDEEKTAVTEEQPKKTNKEKLKEITDGIEQGIREVFESDKYRDYLETMSRFHSYSVNNTMLIYMQKPDATLVAGFNRWRDKFGRNVVKGSKGIKIIAPTPFRKKVEEQKLDPDTKMPVFDKDGKPVMEEKTVQIPMFKPVTVFDVSQTEGKELPELAATLNGKVENYELLKEAIQKVAPVPINFAELDANMDGFFSFKNQSITIREGMSEVQTVCAMIHETAHSILHNTNNKDEMKSQKTEEIEAESIAYAVCKYFGIDTADNSFGYLAAWSKDKEVKELKESLETINSTSSTLISSIEKEYLALAKEHEKQAETAAPAIDETAEALTLLVDDKVYLEVHRIDDGVNVDYSFYDKDSFKLIDGGYSDFALDAQSESVFELAKQIAVSFEYEGKTFVPADIDGEIEQANSLNDAFEKNTPEEPEIKPIVMPDTSVSVSELRQNGVTNEEMLPLSKERAMDLFEAGCPVFLLFEDGKETMVTDRDDILSHYWYLGVDKSDWQAFMPAVEFNDKAKERELSFLNDPNDGFAIYQLRNTDETAGLLFVDSSSLEMMHRLIDKGNYQCVYSGDLIGKSGSDLQKLEAIYEQFNIDRPLDFKGHSLSVSDIVALKQNGEVSYSYVDTIGFKDVPDFGKEHLKTAELSVEDDADMIDGIINNGKKEEPQTVREDAKKKGSVIGKLNTYKKQIASNPPKEQIKDERGLET